MSRGLLAEACLGHQGGFGFQNMLGQGTGGGHLSPGNQFTFINAPFFDARTANENFPAGIHVVLHQILEGWKAGRKDVLQSSMGCEKNRRSLQHDHGLHIHGLCGVGQHKGEAYPFRIIPRVGDDVDDLSPWFNSFVWAHKPQ